MMQEVDVSVEVSASAQQESALPDPKQEPATMDEDSLDDFFSKKDKKKKKERKKKKKAAKAEAAESATNPVVVFSTTAGQFALEIFIHRTPVTASNFIDLVNRNFYNGICFHRVVSDFMIQAGCPNTRSDATFTKALAGKGNGPPNTEFAHLLTGEKLKRNSQGCIDDEYVSNDSNEIFTVAMANTGAQDSGGSQFFINTAHNRPLDWFETDLSPSKHTVFGKVVEGTDVVLAISNTAVDADDRPKRPMRILHSVVSSRPVREVSANE